MTIGVRQAKTELTKLVGVGARLLPIQREHIERFLSLPDHHQDRFDRMIIAQAIQEQFTCISDDERFPLCKQNGWNRWWQYLAPVLA